ncbi:MAG: mechanosensitive ion channel family protein [Candidatus Woesearchaeota archaeon]
MALTVQGIVDYFRNNFAGLYSNILVAFIILLMGFIIGKLLGKLTHRLLNEVGLDHILKKASGVELKLERFLAAAVTYFIYFITIIMVLNQLNVTTTVLQMLSAAVIILIIVSVILAVKDFIPNAFAGIYIYRRDLIKKGEKIRVKGIEGEVAHINLVETKLETSEGDIVYLPNSAITRTEVVKLKKGQGRKKKR